DLHQAFAGVKSPAGLFRIAAYGLDVTRKIRRVDLRLEAGQDVLAERPDNALMLRQGGDDLRRRKRRMQEEADLVPVPAFAQRLRQREEMIVVHPDDVVWPQNLVQFIGEMLVDAQVAAEVTAREFRKIEPVMQDRPQHAVGEAVV